jgi:chitin synthase
LLFTHEILPEYEAEAWEGTAAQDEAQTEDSRSIAHSRRSNMHAPIARKSSPQAPSIHSYHPSTQAGDYYRDTNLTNNSSANPNVRSMHQPSLPNMSQYGGVMPGFAAGPPSITGSMIGPTSLVFPQTNSVFMGGMALPQVPRNSVMTNLNMFGNGGAGSASGRASAFGMPPRMSTFSMATNLNPFAGETDPNPNPSDDEIATVLRGYLSSQDLMTVTKKYV